MKQLWWYYIVIVNKILSNKCSLVMHFIAGNLSKGNFWSIALRTIVWMNRNPIEANSVIPREKEIFARHSLNINDGELNLKTILLNLDIRQIMKRRKSTRQRDYGQIYSTRVVRHCFFLLCLAPSDNNEIYNIGRY